MERTITLEHGKGVDKIFKRSVTKLDHIQNHTHYNQKQWKTIIEITRILNNLNKLAHHILFTSSVNIDNFIRNVN